MLGVERVVAGPERAPVDRHRHQLEFVAIEDERAGRGLSDHGRAYPHGRILGADLEVEIDRRESEARRAVVLEPDRLGG